MAQSPEGSAPLRPFFACLPLQISHFDRLWQLPAVLGVGAASDRFAASLDSEGHLWVDREQLATLAARIDLQQETLDEIRHQHQHHLSRLRYALESQQMAPAEIAERIAALAVYGLLTKALLPRLRQASSAAGGEQQLSLSAAAGWAPELARDLRRAHRHRPAADSADAASRLETELQALSQRWVGLGPHPWELPGFESRDYLLTRVQTATTAVAASRPAATTAGTDWLAEHLGYWTRYLDRQTTTMRGAFYLGLLPALSRVGRSWAEEGALENATDVFFLTRHEIDAGPAANWGRQLSSRRENYFQAIAQSYQQLLPAGRFQQLLTLPARLNGALERARPWFLEEKSATSQPVSQAAPPARITAPQTQAPAATRPNISSSTLLIGRGDTAAMLHTVRGNAHVLGPYADPVDVPDQAILVATRITPDMAPLFGRISALVVEEGGLLQHATGLAREFGLPCVVGIENATKKIQTGTAIEVNGTSGEVRRLQTGLSRIT